MSIAERFHVYEHEGPWPETEEIRSVQEAQQEPDEVRAKAVERAAHIAQFNNDTQLFRIQLAALYDPLALKELEEFLRSNPTPSSADRTKANAMNTRAEDGKRRVSAMPSGTSPSSVSTNCMHFLKHDGIIEDRKNNAMKMALGVNLPSLRGQTLFSPSYQASLVMGHTFMNVEDGHLKIYMGSMSYGSYTIKRENTGTPSARSTYRVPPKLFLTSPDGTGMPSAAVQASDLRATTHSSLAVAAGVLDPLLDLQKPDTKQIGKSSHGHKMFMKYSTIPLSYTYLFQKEQDTCTPQLKEHLENAPVHDMWPGYEKQDEFFAAMPCGQVFVRGGQDYSNGLDYIEVVWGWSHFLMEWPAERYLHAIRGSETLENGWHWKHLPEATGELLTDVTPILQV